MTAHAWDTWLPTTVNVHVERGTEFAWTVHASEGRIVFKLRGSNMSDMALFLHQRDLHRLQEAFSAAVAELDEAIAA